jgi:hypothetical protein
VVVVFLDADDGGRRRRDATKPPTPRLAAVEAAEQALILRVWGWGGVGFAGAGE